MGRNKKTTTESSSYSKFPPVVAVLGHVDHGKTTLLDAIRKTNVASREHGGITQKIGASTIVTPHEKKLRTITFLDTPGHETFMKMRSRGAKVADIGLLIVAANDGVKPQTKESIAILKDAAIPFIVVVTKTDLPEANVDKAKQELAKEDILVEGFGGDVPVIEVSAKTGKNVSELLGLILLVFDLQEKKPLGSALKAVVIESKLDRNAGPRATVVIKQGKIAVREEVVNEGVVDRVRTIISDTGENVKEATVGSAVEILGWTKVPQVGSVLTKKGEEAEAEKESLVTEVEEYAPHATDTTLAMILRADSVGSLEAIIESLPKNIQFISSKAGEVTTADVLMAKSTGSIIIGFNIRVDPAIAQMAKTEKVLLKNYTVIYELISEVTEAHEGKALSLEEEVYGIAKIQGVFPYEKTKVAGFRVTEGRIARGDKVRIVRNNEIIGEGSISSVRQGKNATSKVEEGQEGGAVITPLLDFTIGDMLVCHG